ncbi:MAG: hypothetical protein KIS78_16510, partial [Labilithrix sp.]|nr:hypothetical protein [Labilithrix sp.]
GEIDGRRGAITPLDDGAPAASAASGSETRGGSGAFGLRGGIARAPASGACGADRGSIRETGLTPVSLERAGS